MGKSTSHSHAATLGAQRGVQHATQPTPIDFGSNEHNKNTLAQFGSCTGTVAEQRHAIFDGNESIFNNAPTIQQRRSGYGTWHSLMNGAEDCVPETMQGVQFYKAAGIVTSDFGVGAAETMPGISAEAKSLLQGINKDLLRNNQAVLQDMLRKGKLTDPTTDSPEALDAFAFDLKMVDFEQGRVEDTLKKNNVDAAVIKEINELSSMTGSQALLTMYNPTLLQARKMAAGVLGLTPDQLDFGEHKHRVAIGKALICILHNKSLKDYERVMAP